MYGHGLNAATMDINIHQLQQDTTTTTTFTTTTCTATSTTTTTNNNNNNNTIAGLQIVDNLDLTGKGQIFFSELFSIRYRNQSQFTLNIICTLNIVDCKKSQ